MEKNMKYILVIAIIILFISIFTIVYSYTNKNDEMDIYSKIDEEINYIDIQVTQIMKMINNLNTDSLESINVSVNEQDENVSGSEQGEKKESDNKEQKPQNIEIITQNSKPIISQDRNNIDWISIQSQLEKLSNSLAIITIDLATININNENILSLNVNIDEALNYLNNRDKTNLLISLAKLYSALPEYKKQYSNDINSINFLYIKSDILSSYAILETNNWENISTILSDADSRMISLLNSEHVIDDKSQSMNKLYVLLKEYIKSVNEMNMDLSYMRFYYLVSQLENV